MHTIDTLVDLIVILLFAAALVWLVRGWCVHDQEHGRNYRTGSRLPEWFWQEMGVRTGK